jgi:hypothetical protein
VLRSQIRPVYLHVNVQEVDVPNKSRGPVQRALLFASELSNRKHKDCRSVQPIIAGKTSAQRQSKIGLEAQYESKKPLCHASLKMK